MDLEDPPVPDLTEQNRRQFMRRTGAAGVVAALGLSGQASAAMEDGEFETDPYSLGVASGDPLPDSVILWTRLAPNPLEAGGGMPDESVEVNWEVATDEAMTDVVRTGTATAEPAHAHTIHVDVGGLEPATEYYYRFEAGGKQSEVGRTRTAPAADASPEAFRFAFASCQAWPDGFYTAYRYMAEEELDLVVHLGDYMYEYGIGANGGARNTSVPQAFRSETETLERYRLQYGLYKSDPDLRAAHASAPWLITRDDHEVDNNWAGDVPQDPDKQTVEAFLVRRAAAFKAYYEHMPFRMAQKPDGPDQKLYRNYTFGDLVEFNVLDTRLYRSDQACGDAFNVVDCQARFAEDRTILGDEQEEWLVDNLENSTATWDVLANQLPFARMDFKRGGEEGYRMDQWDGYVAVQNTVKRAFEDHAENPVVITGDFHSNWASDIRSAEEESKTIGAEFVGTSISSGGDGSEFDDFNGDEPGALGKHVIRENENVVYNNDKRGYTRCTVTPEDWTTEFQVVEYVTRPGAPMRTDARFTVEAGVPGLQQPPTTLDVDSIAVSNGTVGTAELTAQWLPEGLSGGSVTLSLSESDVASFTGVSVLDSFGLGETAISEDGNTARLRFVDTEGAVQDPLGPEDVPLASLDIRGDRAGTTDLEVNVEAMDDDTGNAVETRTRMGVLVVGPPPAADSEAPTDPDGDGRYEDLNGNGRLDYDDVNTLFENIDADSVRLNEAAYDFNENGQIDYDDVVDLYEAVS
ncbi:alkaline phosphatase [Halobacteriales archaeon QS_5_70_15]|nr:MAG: alkaline phosphatase [Halobacteriales archaeon QS_5_70_15]